MGLEGADILTGLGQTTKSGHHEPWTTCSGCSPFSCQTFWESSLGVEDLPLTPEGAEHDQESHVKLGGLKGVEEQVWGQVVAAWKGWGSQGQSLEGLG